MSEHSSILNNAFTGFPNSIFYTKSDFDYDLVSINPIYRCMELYLLLTSLGFFQTKTRLTRVSSNIKTLIENVWKIT